MGTFDALYASLNPNQQQRGFEFEHVCKWFLENDPKYTSRLKRVWLWKEWPGRWSDIDTGIDLVAEETDGKLWAIQAKSYREDRKIPKEELNKFLSESNRREFTYRLLITTTSEGLHHIAAKTVYAQEKPVLIVDLPDLRDSPVSWPGSLADLRPAPPREPAEPREHQAAAILDVLGGFESHDRGQLLMACGTGKTLTAWFLREKLDAQRTLVLVPSLSLLKQTMHEWERAAGGCAPFTTLPVCSDSSVRNTDDPAVAFTAELGVPVTTDPEMIAKFLRGRGPRVVFSTYQSSPQVAEAFTLPRVPAFDLVIADEAHRVAGDESSVFATILNPDAIKARRRLFMTATPRYFTGRVIKKAQESDEMVVASMDDHTKFGEVFHKLSFGEAIRRGLLTDYQVAVIGVDSHDPTYREWADTGTLLKRDGKATDGRILASQIGLAKALRTDKYDLRRVISFHSTIARARQFAAELPDVIDWMPKRQRPTGRLWTGVATGEMSAGERHVRLQRLRQLDDDERGLLANARCLSEGVDVPTLDGVAFIDPKGSEVDIIQAVGRAIRLADDKTIGTIVIPVFIDPDQDPEEALSDSSFKAVWRVINALRAHDEELAEQIDSFRRELGRRGGKAQIPDKIHLDVTRDVSQEFSDAFDVRLVERTSESWEFWFGLLERYTAENGDARPPITFAFGDHQLGVWVPKQRSKFNARTLSPEHQQRLQDLPGWTWDPRDDLWEEGFTQLQEHVRQHGTARSTKDAIFNGFQLGGWISTQRTAYRQQRLAPERIQRLEALLGWTWNTRTDRWPFWFGQLQKFVAEHGHTRLAALELYEGQRVGQWVAQQRYHRNAGNLEEDRIQLLEDTFPDWTWDAVTEQWEEGFRQLVAYSDQRGDCLVSQKFVTESGHRLGGWVTKQRAECRSGELSEERQRRLEDLPGWAWTPLDYRWEKCFQILAEFAAEHGHTRVVQGSSKVDGVDLGSWVGTQRNRFARGVLAPDRVARLEALPGWLWDVNPALWEKGFELLSAYAAIHGNCDVRHSYKSDGHNLGAWVALQRTNGNNGKLREDYRARLEALPGWTWSVLDAKWEEGFRQLQDYIARTGTVRMLPKYRAGDYPLGSWVGKNREAYRRGALSDERVRRLESLPEWEWDPMSERWERSFSALKGYANEHGNVRAPQDLKVGEVKLGQWASIQRAAYAKGKLSLERKRRLETLPGWSWNDVLVDVWEERFAALQLFAAREGHGRVPQKHVEDGAKLGFWVSQQRGHEQKGTLSPERRQRLEAIPGWAWHGKDALWEDNFALLMQYTRENGTSCVPYSAVFGGTKLGMWVYGQRSAYSKGRLSEDRRKRLEKLPGWQWRLR